MKLSERYLESKGMNSGQLHNAASSAKEGAQLTEPELFMAVSFFELPWPGSQTPPNGKARGVKLRWSHPASSHLV